jgi:DNA-binding NarL/FixJ family response regulator
MDSRRIPSRLRVVLVEDSALLGQLLRDMLAEIEGVDVVAVAAGESAALRALQEQPSDLVIVDLQLTDGSGVAVLRTLRLEPECYGRPVAVVLSNNGDPRLRSCCRALGVERFFDMALQMDELIDFVGETRRTVADGQ